MTVWGQCVDFVTEVDLASATCDGSVSPDRTCARYLREGDGVGRQGCAMNNPDKAREPSMDEILASIRKIIAEEPSDARDGNRGHDESAFDRNRSAQRTLREAVPAERSPATFTRPSFECAESQGDHSSSRTACAGKRPSSFSMRPPSSFEDDLSDLLDAPCRRIPSSRPAEAHPAWQPAAAC